MKQRSVFVLLVMLVTALFVSACRGGEQPEGAWLEPRTDTSLTTEPEPEVAAGATVIVMLQDGLIAAPDEPIAPGPVVFTIENRGTEVHNLFIEGAGVDRAADAPVSPGETTSLDARLEAGTYTLYCPILDHRTRGEEVQMTVQQP
jgi:uncharacterized cupredoxin-like copper-binding protein